MPNRSNLANCLSTHGVSFSFFFLRQLQKPYSTDPGWGKGFFAVTTGAYLSGVVKDRKWLGLK
jgi:hypothetical protein